MGLLLRCLSSCAAAGRVVLPLCRSMPETDEGTGELLRERLAAEQVRGRAPLGELETGLAARDTDVGLG